MSKDWRTGEHQDWLAKQAAGPEQTAPLDWRAARLDAKWAHRAERNDANLARCFNAALDLLRKTLSVVEHHRECIRDAMAHGDLVRDEADELDALLARIKEATNG